MNEQAQESLAELIKYATSGVDAMVAFGQEQLPILVEQLLMWHFVESLLWFSLGLILLMLTPFLFKKVSRVLSEKMEDARRAYIQGERWTRFSDSGTSTTSYSYDNLMFGCSAGKWLLIPMGFVGFLMASANLSWLKIWIAPKLYLFEYGASLVK